MRKTALSPENFNGFNSLLPHLRYIAWDRYDQPWELGYRIIYDHEFLLIRGGEGEFIIGGVQYTARPGDLILLQPEILHTGRSVRLPFQFICIHFDIYCSRDNRNLDYRRYFTKGEFPKMNLETLVREKIEYEKAYLDFPVHRTIQDNGILAGFERIFHESYHSRPGWSTVCTSTFIELLTLLFREISEPEREGRGGDYPAVDEAAEYIRDHLADTLQIRELATGVHLSTDYFSRLFKKRMGVTPQQYILYCRMAHARLLLGSSTAKLEWVARQCGYEDIHYFSRLFRKYEGISPSEYRQTITR